MPSRQSIRRAAGVTVAIVLCAFSAPAAESLRWQFGLAYNYSSGDYGGDDTTEVTYVPFGVKRYFDWGDLTLTVPYVRVVNESGAVLAQDDVIVTGSGEKTDESGLGDTLLKARYFAVEERGNIPYVDLTLRLRLPTADEDKGLGSGDPDLTFATELTRTVGATSFLLGELGYTVTDSLDLDNRFLYSVGYAHRLNEACTLSGYLDGRTAVASGASDPLSLLGLAEYRFRPDLRFDLMLELGLSDGSPDYGVMLGIRYRSLEFPRPIFW